MKRWLFVCLVALPAFLIPSRACWIRNQPYTAVDADGIRVPLFLSGDEYFNRMHDVDDFTVVRDPDTGFLVYAVLKDDRLVPTHYRIGRNLPRSVGLKPGIVPSDKTITGYRERFVKLGTGVDDSIIAPQTGTFTNIVIFVRFADQEEFPETTPFSTWDNLFNGVENTSSLRNYFKETSYNKLTINSIFRPLPGDGKVYSFRNLHKRDYFQPFNAVTNPIGYTTDAERKTREHTLISAAVEAYYATIGPEVDVDADKDGRVDNVVFAIRGAVGPGILWPHKWQLDTDNVKINGKPVRVYNFQIEENVIGGTGGPVGGVGVLCHEMGHSLGFPDLYRGSGTDNPVGRWDLMAYNQNPPQHIGAYMKAHYTKNKWLTLNDLFCPGAVSVAPLRSNAVGYRIVSPPEAETYCVVEYRDRGGLFDASLPGKGLIITRINKTRESKGNYEGPPDEVYVCRPGGGMGDPANAAYANTDFDDPDDAFRLENISDPGDNITFTYNRLEPPLARWFEFWDGPWNAYGPRPCAGITLQPPVCVRAMEQCTGYLYDYSGPVDIFLSNAPDGAYLTGTTTVDMTFGEACFIDLAVAGNSGSGPVTFTVSASGFYPAVSLSFWLNAAMFYLEFQRQPVYAEAGEVFDCVVRALDKMGSPTSCADWQMCVVSIVPGTGTADASLSGSTERHFINEQAQFMDLSIDLPGTGYILKAECAGFYALSQPFDILQPPYGAGDIVDALLVSLGNREVTGPAFTRLNVTNEGQSAGRVDTLDAVKIARKVAGWE
jgi:M6 family metalloprotease-like protein